MLSRSIFNTVKGAHRWKAAVSDKAYIRSPDLLRSHLRMCTVSVIIPTQFSSSAALSSPCNSPRNQSAKFPRHHNVIVSDLLLLANSNRSVFAARRFSPNIILGAAPSSVRHLSTTNARSNETTSGATVGAKPPSTSLAEAASTTGEAKPNLVK